MLNYFNFKKIKDDILITNDIGNYAILSQTDFQTLVEDKIDQDHPRYCELVNKRFLFAGNKYVATGHTAQELRVYKNYLWCSTGLHIFVLTNMCNMSCRYCQAKSNGNIASGIMTREIAQKAVDIALQSPNSLLTFEMQGGEPFFNFETLKFIVEYAELMKGSKCILYSVTTNATLLTDEILDFCEKYSVSISVSLDGPANVQQYNRPMNNGENSFGYIEAVIPKLRKRDIFGGAVLTTTKFSFEYWREIIDTYLLFGMEEVFIRPLTPLGYAIEHWEQIGYDVEEYLDFYKLILGYILELNKQGVLLRDTHAMIFLCKILYQRSDNYMELRSPCGATIGQLAYYYDGNIYACDAGRMIAQMGEDSFCIGNVHDSSYMDLIGCTGSKAVCKASILEALPGCTDCVYMPYCGTCPVITYASEKSLLTRKSNNYRCKVYKGIMDIIFEHLMIPADKEVFISWFN